MREESKLDIMTAEEHDHASKIIWRNREILAPLLKYSITELADESIEDIMRLIDANSISEDIPVSDLPATITELGEEHSSTIEMPVTFDLKFNVKNPKLSDKNIFVVLHIDLEFQNKYRPTAKDGKTYTLIKRGIYYAARDLSSRL